MEPYQERVIKEKEELDDKVSKLTNFLLTSDEVKKLSNETYWKINVIIWLSIRKFWVNELNHLLDKL